MTKYKDCLQIGDIVRCISQKVGWRRYKGLLGIITERSCGTYAIHWQNDRNSAWFDKSELQLIKKLNWSDYDTSATDAYFNNNLKFN